MKDIFIVIIFFCIFKYLFMKTYYINLKIINIPYKPKIPKILFQTYYNKKNIPSKVYKNIKKYAPDYKHYILDDNDGIKFIQKYYGQNLVNVFNNINNGAHKADLLRYCLLYKYGGVYLDIKTELTNPLNKLIKDESAFHSVLSIMGDSIYQGVIFTPPGNEIFKKCINTIIKNSNPFNYLLFTEDLYSHILKDINKSKLYPGLNKGNYNYYLFQEKCEKDKNMCYDGLDRYGLCCFIYDHDKEIIKSRYADFPWK